MTPCPNCDSASTVDEEGCCIHCGAPRDEDFRRAEEALERDEREARSRDLARMADEDARYDAAVEEQARDEEEQDGE